MKPLALLKVIRQHIISLLYSQIDIIPPYRYVEGTLKIKEAAPGGQYFLIVGTQKMRVDKVTFDILSIGEELRIMCTRAHRVIEITRKLPGEGSSLY